MKNFLVIYHAAPEAMAQMAEATPEQQAEGMKHWFDWKDRIGDGIVDFGSPLMGGTVFKSGSNLGASDKEVTGYSIIQAADFASAEKMLDNHPHLHWHASATIELHETMKM